MDKYQLGLSVYKGANGYRFGVSSYGEGQLAAGKRVTYDQALEQGLHSLIIAAEDELKRISRDRTVKDAS